ncbi:MAG: PQ-loop repeat-containing protein [Francisellaceae bacterium]
MEHIGTISINISFALYCIYFLPQVIYNQIYRHASRISHTTQFLMILANTLDLIYGFGFNLQWQYRMVTIITLICLLIQQWQIWRDESSISWRLHLAVFATLIIGMILALVKPLADAALENIGFASMIAYSVYFLPQIVKNYQQKAADGFSISFILLNALALLCDEVSALSFNWPLPSIISPAFILAFLVIMIVQSMFYKRPHPLAHR